jgi:lactate dehydrogenase-like 2-hydroxyacid dehydrogenase
MPPRIVVTRRLPGSGLELLRELGEVWVSPHERGLTEPELRDAVRGAEVLVTMLHDRITGALMAAAGPQLRVIAQAAVGYDNVDLAAAAARGVLVTNTPGVLTDATADLAIGLLLGITRRIGEGERMIRAQQPWRWDMFLLLGRSLRGKTLGIVGLGEIGQATARRARAFGMEIVYAQRTPSPPAVESELGARRLALQQLLATADAVSLHCPLTPETRHLIDAAALAVMKPSAYLVNTARGPVVDESALVQALREGVIAGAALDVYEHEPEVSAGLLELDNVVLVPHLGSAAMLAARNVAAVLGGDPPLTPVSG